jgi:hypothetical protein
VKFCRYRQLRCFRPAFAPFRMTPLRNGSAGRWALLLPPYLPLSASN